MRMHACLHTHAGPYALLVKRQTFQTYKMKTAIPNKFKMTREEAIKCVVDNVRADPRAGAWAGNTR